MKQSEDEVRRDQVTEDVDATPRTSTWRDAENEHEWNDKKWARCVLCGIYEDDYEPSELPECSDKARDNYLADCASDYDEPCGCLGKYQSE